MTDLRIDYSKIEATFRYHVIDTRKPNTVAGMYSNLDDTMKDFYGYFMDFPGRYVVLDTVYDVIMDIGVKYAHSQFRAQA